MAVFSLFKLYGCCICSLAQVFCASAYTINSSGVVRDVGLGTRSCPQDHSRPFLSVLVPGLEPDGFVLSEPGLSNTSGCS